MQTLNWHAMPVEAGPASAKRAAYMALSIRPSNGNTKRTIIGETTLFFIQIMFIWAAAATVAAVRPVRVCSVNEPR
jgi:hypothetical protein